MNYVRDLKGFYELTWVHSECVTYMIWYQSSWQTNLVRYIAWAAKFMVKFVYFSLLSWEKYVTPLVDGKTNTHLCKIICHTTLQYKHLIPAQVDRTSASAWLLKQPW